MHNVSQQEKSTTSKKAVAAAAIGNALEWYDFTIYALFAIYMAKNFFPSDNENVALINSFLAFGLGFVIRPLGAVVLGAYADKAGRKAALFLTIMIMAAGTFIIAVAPVYVSIGIGAPLLILCGRLLQGFSAGGEIGSATSFLVEHAPTSKKGRYAAWLQASMALSNILGAIVALSVTALLATDQIEAWGWRIPFALGLLIVPVGLWLRISLNETPAFEREAQRQKAQQIQHTPIKIILRDYPLALLKGIAFAVLWASSTYVMIVYMPVFVQRAFGFSGQEAFTAAVIGNIFLFSGCLFCGAVSDRIGRRTTLIGAAILLVVLVFPLLAWLQAAPYLSTLIIAQSCFCLLVSGIAGVAPSALSEVFPVHIRSTGMSLSYNISTTIFGGFAPATLTWLNATSLGVFSPGWYILVAALIGTVAVLRMNEQSQIAKGASV